MTTRVRTPGWRFPDEQTGEDLEWLAHDLEDRVALFATLGLGPVPAALRAEVRAGQLVESIAKLPETTTAVCNDALPRSAQWAAIGRCGLFGYQWDAFLGRYDCVVRPIALAARPVLPGELAAAAATVRLFARFERSDAVSTATTMAVAPER